MTVITGLVMSSQRDRGRPPSSVRPPARRPSNRCPRPSRSGSSFKIRSPSETMPSISRPRSTTGRALTPLLLHEPDDVLERREPSTITTVLRHHVSHGPLHRRSPPSDSTHSTVGAPERRSPRPTVPCRTGTRARPLGGRSTPVGALGVGARATLVRRGPTRRTDPVRARPVLRARPRRPCSSASSSSPWRSPARRYGALASSARTARSGEFVTTGVTAEQRAAIGDPPTGRGVLGVLIAQEGHPMRLRRSPIAPRLRRLPPEPPADDLVPRGPDRRPRPRCSATST